jgi:predicted chitinase
MDPAIFFSTVKASLFGGALTQNQVDTMNALFASWAKHGGTDQRQLAYVFGTVYHEAGRAMVPVREGFSSSNESAIAAVTSMFNRHIIKTNYALPDPVTGQSYYGRGFVQITWKANYAAFEKLLNIPLVTNPDLALQTTTSAEIAVIGMMNGVFTGKKLSDYFNATITDWTNARKIINGLDRTAIIAGYAQNFYTALKAAAQTA